MNTKNNQRFIETENRIETIFINLLNDKNIKEITVRSLCKKANINPSTFYAHYRDIYDLLDKLERNMNRKLMAQFDSLEINENLFTTEKFFIPFLEFISKNKTFYKACLQKRKSFPIEEGAKELFNLVIKPNCLKKGITSEDEMMYYFVFFQAGITMVLKRWVDNDLKENSKEICKYIMNCLPKI
ncbi:MAG: TetR/AcrR family transcriptional regulator [Clostridiales bacterium]|nr:TetR/AcrR family transcriptional regulator [Clostridiales bacterium]